MKAKQWIAMVTPAAVRLLENQGFKPLAVESDGSAYFPLPFPTAPHGRPCPLKRAMATMELEARLPGEGWILRDNEGNWHLWLAGQNDPAEMMPISHFRPEALEKVSP